MQHDETDVLRVPGVEGEEEPDPHVAKYARDFGPRVLYPGARLRLASSDVAQRVALTGYRLRDIVPLDGETLEQAQDRAEAEYRRKRFVALRCDVIAYAIADFQRLIAQRLDLGSIFADLRSGKPLNGAQYGRLFYGV